MMARNERNSLTSARGLISLLHEAPIELHEFAIRRLSDIVDEFWFEIADSVSIIELYSEAENFRERRLAALLASKLHYHLGSHDKAMWYALGAGDLLYTSGNGEYLLTVIKRCIKQYQKERNRDEKLTDPRLEMVIATVFNNCLRQRDYHNAIGLAIETNRTDLLRTLISSSEDPSSILKHTLQTIIHHFPNRNLRRSVLQCLAEIYTTLWKPDVLTFCKCLLYLEDHTMISTLLARLLREDDRGTLIAYQIAFDLYENARRELLKQIMNSLEDIRLDNENEDMVLEARIRFLSSILHGDLTTEFYHKFLTANNHTDYVLLENMKNTIKDKICHSAVVFANSFMNYGTFSDTFVINHIDWWCQESHWAEFSATAGLGVINKGSEEDSIRIMSEYFPDNTHRETVYTEGGILYGLGLIHAYRGEKITDYLLHHLETATSLEVIHGACLGIGLAALGTNHKNALRLLLTKLHQNEATIGESVGIAIGLICIGSKCKETIQEIMKAARSTKHEKVVRGLAIGVALIMFGCLEECEPLVLTLWNDINPLLRCAAMHTLAMAYCGAGDSKVAQRLLSVAGSDPSGDVRRAAIQALGFIFINDSDNCISVLSLLADNYSLHTRYGASIALGVSCAGTGNEAALSLLLELASDTENLVAQGALIASALILIQHTPSTCSKLTKFKVLYQEITENKKKSEITKFGAILAQGIINGGGRNVTISLSSRLGHMRMEAIAGMLIFSQYWYWFPLIHFLSLSFLPTCLIGINSDMMIAEMEFISNAKPSKFGYPPPAKRRRNRLDDLFMIIIPFSFKEVEIILDEIGEEKEANESEEDNAGNISSHQPEADFEILTNPARVTMEQRKYVQIPGGSMYEPVKDIAEGGIIVMLDKKKRKVE